MFGSILVIELEKARKSFIGDYGDLVFSPFIDDYNGATRDFDLIFNILHKQYFLRVIWAPIYLSGKKCSFFILDLDFIRFIGGLDGVRPLVKHRDRILY